MVNDQALLSLATAHGSPFVVQRCIWHMANQGEIAKAKYLDPKISNAVASIWKSHNTIYGVCQLHVDQLYNQALHNSRWNARRKLKKIEQQWKTGMWLTLTIEAHEFVDKHTTPAT